MLAICSKRILRPSAKASCIGFNSSTEWTLPKVRTGCSPLPKSVLPPALSCCTWRSWREILAALIPKACNLTGSRAIDTSRLTPPTRFTAPTPRTLSKRLVIVSSTNQDKASVSRCDEATVNAKIGEPATSNLPTTGSRKSLGKSARTFDTAERTSSTASCTGFSKRNSAVMLTLPSWTLLVMCFKPCKVAIEFSILRATSVSSCDGEAPGKLAVTVTVGKSRSGKF